MLRVCRLWLAGGRVAGAFWDAALFQHLNNCTLTDEILASDEAGAQAAPADLGPQARDGDEPAREKPLDGLGEAVMPLESHPSGSRLAISRSTSAWQGWSSGHQQTRSLPRNSSLIRRSPTVSRI